jgi:predicted polyphosphate/ATP-dependent NAD kinase
MNNKAVKHPIVTIGAGTAYPSGTPEFSPVIVKRSIVTFLGSQILLDNKPLKKQ